MISIIIEATEKYEFEELDDFIKETLLSWLLAKDFSGRINIRNFEKDTKEIKWTNKSEESKKPLKKILPKKKVSSKSLSKPIKKGIKPAIMAKK